jgi:hypothetical protein
MGGREVGKQAAGRQAGRLILVISSYPYIHTACTQHTAKTAAMVRACVGLNV